MSRKINVKKLICSAEEGNVRDQYILGLYYYSASRRKREIDKNKDEKSAHWYERAANSGHMGAMMKLASYYYQFHEYQSFQDRDGDGDQKKRRENHRNNLLTSLSWLQKILDNHTLHKKPSIKLVEHLYLVNKGLKNFCQAKNWFAQYLQLTLEDGVSNVVDVSKRKQYRMFTSHASMLMEEADHCQDCGQKKVAEYEDAASNLRQAAALASNSVGKNTTLAEISLFRLFFHKKIKETRKGEANELAIKLINTPFLSSEDLFIGQRLYRFVIDIDPFLALNWCYKCCFEKGYSWAIVEYAFECWHKSSFEILEKVAASAGNITDQPAYAVYTNNNIKESAAAGNNYFEIGLQLLHNEIQKGNDVAKDYLKSQLDSILYYSTYEKNDQVDGGKHRVFNLEKDFEILLLYTSVDKTQEIISQALKYRPELFASQVFKFVEYGFNWRKYLSENEHQKLASQENGVYDKLILQEDLIKKAYEEIITCSYFPTEVSKIITSYIPWARNLRCAGFVFK
jgi:hypothetical protein